MNPKDLDELLESVREGGRILRGEAEPSREFTFKPEDVQAIRKKLKKLEPLARGRGLAAATPNPVSPR